MDEEVEKESLPAAYKVPGFRAQARVEVYEIIDRPALAITLERRQKKRCVPSAARCITAIMTKDGLASVTLIAGRTRRIWTSNIGARRAESAAA